ncbi:MAG: hypothetical protein IKW89_11760 [Bacteroidales bacterium]|nr:hypothetical protein [Bacteroidales bacterium]
MRRFIFVIILMSLSLCAWAQYAGTGTIKRAGTHIVMDGERLSPEAQEALLADIGGLDYNSAWDLARKGRNTGLGLVIGGSVATIGGSVVTLLGLATSVIGAAVGGAVGSVGGQESAQHGAEEGAKAGNSLTIGGLITSGLGLVTTGIGIPMIVKNNRTLNEIVNGYNNGRQPNVKLGFGPTENGIGLALRF